MVFFSIHTVAGCYSPIRLNAESPLLFVNVFWFAIDLIENKANWKYYGEKQIKQNQPFERKKNEREKAPNDQTLEFHMLTRC